MLQISLALLCVVAAIFVPMFLPQELGLARKGTRVAFAFMALFFAASTSYVYVGDDETGHLSKIYGSDELQNGRVVAVSGEKGKQARILRPGFQFIPFVSVIYDIEKLPMVNIPAGFYGLIETRDGAPLPSGSIMAANWSDETFQNMLDAEYFLNNGGQKGLQTAVLKPGKYPINLYLFKVTIGNGASGYVYNQNGRKKVDTTTNTLQTNIPAGHVGVVTSKIQTKSDDQCRVTHKTVVDADGIEVAGALSVPLVPIDCRGIWDTAKLPGGYFLNRNAYDVTLVDTRVQTWRYEGGYESRRIDLTVDAENGKIIQDDTTTTVAVPEGSADSSVTVKVEGWTAHQSLRAVVQVTPENAPIVVAAVGGLKEVEDRIITPAIISEVRDVVGGVAELPKLDKNGQRLYDDAGEVITVTRSVKILDLVENRDYLQNAVDAKVREHGKKAGVNIMEVRFANPDLPPEMLVARKREQLATQLSKAYATERLAQVERQSTEEARARADKQHQLVQADINVDVAGKVELEKAKLGNAEKAYLTALAEGEEARANVLGQDRVMMLNITDKVLNTLAANPELVKMVGKLVPNTVVMGSGGGLEGPMAVLGNALGRKNGPVASGQ